MSHTFVRNEEKASWSDHLNLTLNCRLQMCGVFVRTESKIGLQLVCLLNEQFKEAGIYSHDININEPKLLSRLLNFCWTSPKYILCPKQNNFYKDCFYMCNKCDELYLPADQLLTHMANAHNVHLPTNKCIYCNAPLNHSPYQCYLNATKHEQYPITNEKVEYLNTIFAILHRFLRKYEIITARSKNYSGLGYMASFKRKKNKSSLDDDECSMVAMRIFTNNRKPKYRIKKIGREFKLLMVNYYGANFNQPRNWLICDDNKDLHKEKTKGRLRRLTTIEIDDQQPIVKRECGDQFSASSLPLTTATIDELPRTLQLPFILLGLKFLPADEYLQLLNDSLIWFRNEAFYDFFRSNLEDCPLLHKSHSLMMQLFPDVTNYNTPVDHYYMLQDHQFKLLPQHQTLINQLHTLQQQHHSRNNAH